MRVAVLGAGTWGTAFSNVLTDAGNEVTLWARRPELAARIERDRCNRDYLPDLILADSVHATADARRALAGAELVAIAVPAQSLREHLGEWTLLIPADAIVLSLMKGIELGTTKRMSELIIDVAGVGKERVAVLSGPNLAKEIAQRQPSATVIGCPDLDVAQRIQRGIATPYFRPYTNDDIIGSELGGAVKNVIALAVGIADGIGLGDNAKASLITRGLSETTRLGATLGADPMTFAGLAGLGDLVATCSSPLSRNRTVGEQLARGRSMSDIAAEMHTVAEGVQSSRAILDLARAHDVDMPITQHVAAVVHDGASPLDTVRQLMGRETKQEMHGLQ
jgi:glycerol-3-phosphate dehydrogenase (NAD(P)+)